MRSILSILNNLMRDSRVEAFLGVGGYGIRVATNLAFIPIAVQKFGSGFLAAYFYLQFLWVLFEKLDMRVGFVFQNYVTDNRDSAPRIIAALRKTLWFELLVGLCALLISLATCWLLIPSRLFESPSFGWRTILIVCSLMSSVFLVSIAVRLANGLNRVFETYVYRFFGNFGLAVGVGLGVLLDWSADSFVFVLNFFPVAACLVQLVVNVRRLRRQLIHDKTVVEAGRSFQIGPALREGWLHLLIDAKSLVIYTVSSSIMVSKLDVATFAAFGILQKLCNVFHQSHGMLMASLWPKYRIAFKSKDASPLRKGRAWTLILSLTGCLAVVTSIILFAEELGLALSWLEVLAFSLFIAAFLQYGNEETFFRATNIAAKPAMWATGAFLFFAAWLVLLADSLAFYYFSAAGLLAALGILFSIGYNRRSFQFTSAYGV